MFYQIDEKHRTKGIVPIAPRQFKSTRIVNNKSSCLCMNCNDTYLTLFQVKNYVDLIKNSLPCDEKDTANISKYEYELTIQTSHDCVCLIALI